MRVSVIIFNWTHRSVFIAFVLNTLMFSTLSAQHRNTFILRGSVSGKDNGKIYLRYSYQNKKILDSSNIKDGNFVFNGLLDEPVKAELSDNRKLMREDYANYLPGFYIEPGEMSISLVDKYFANAKLKGSQTDDDYKLFYNELNPVLSNIQRVQNEIKSANIKNTLFTDSLIFYNNTVKEISGFFIKNHTNSFIAVKAIMELSVYKEIGPDSCLTLLSSLSSEVQNLRIVKKSKEAYIAERSSALGQLAREFTRKDVKGKSIQLSYLKGKYVLLDFWASWCIPCRELTPRLKKMYEKYHSKGLEVIAVSCDSKYEAWVDAIRTDSIESFVNILSFTDSDMDFLKTHDIVGDASFEGELRKYFNLKPIPVEILINKEGVIIGRYGATEKQALSMLEKKLSEIFDGIK
jgi:thiol-disulfide isomerase/thioredoxin